MQKPIQLVGGVLMVAALARSASAQPQVPAEEAPTGRFNLGSATSFTPAVVAVAGYDTNLGRTADSVGGSEYYVVPQVEGWIGRGKVRLNVAGAMEYGENSVTGSQLNHRYEGRLEARGSRLSGYALAAHGDVYAPPSDFVGFELGLKTRRVQNLFEGSVTLRSPGRVRYSALARLSQLRYDADQVYEDTSLALNLNRDSTVLQGDVDVLITPLSSAIFTAAVFKERFLLAPTRDGDGYNLLAGGQFASGALLTGRAQVGVIRYTTTFNDATYGGPTYYLGLMVNRGRLFLDVAGNRQIDFSFDPDKGFYVTSGLDVFLTLRYRTAWEVFGRASWRRMVPQGPRAAIESDVNLQIYKGGIARGVGRYAKIGVEAEKYISRGASPFTALRGIVFLTYGSTRLQRLDRPLPGEF